MKHKNRLLFLAAFVLLAIPLALVLNAGAASTVLPNVNIWFGNSSINENGGWRIDDPSCVMHPEAEMWNECRQIVLSAYTDLTTCQTQICSDGSAKTAAQCNAAGLSMVNRGTWQNICSDLAYGTQIACLATPGNYSWTNPFCSDPQYISQTTCTTNAETWTPSSCSNPVYTSATTCTTAYLDSGDTWAMIGCSNPSYTTAPTCTTNTWDGITCSNPVYTTQPTCSLATWNGSICSNPAYTTAATCTTGTALSNNTWNPTFVCSDPLYTDALSCTTVPTGRTWTQACTATWADGSSVTAGYYGTLALCSNPAYTDLTSCTTGGGDWQQLWTGSYNGGCQHCHGYTSRSTSSVWNQGAEFPMNSHRNALRKVTPGVPLGGADWTSSNSTIPNQTNLSTATDITYIFPDVPGAAPYTTDLSSAEYIVGGWYKAVKKAEISRKPVTGNEPVIMTTSACAECHATGYVGKAGVGVGRNGLTTGGNKWLYDGVQCAECHSGWPIYGNGNSYSIMENPPLPATNQTGTQICAGCHQQRVGGVAGTVQPAQLAVDSSTGAFVGFPIGNQFLNSPHARFSGTATAAAVGSPNAYDSSFASGTTTAYCSDPNYSTLATCTAGSGSWAGTCSNPSYKVFAACTTGGGSWAAATTVNVNAGCLNCHDVHVGAVDPDTMDPTNSQSSINSNRHCQSCHNTIDLTIISHPNTSGTPLDSIGVAGHDQTKATELACITCHMGPDLNHLVRINTDAGYSTATPGSSLANTYTDGGYTQAVGIDLNHACGQCHSVTTGSAQNRFTTGTMSVLAEDIHNNIPRTADFSAAASATVKKQVDFVATGCSDGGTCSYKWKFSDGQSMTVATAATSHIFPSAGTYLAVVTVTEGSSVSMSRIKSVTAISVNVPPTAAKTITQSGWTVNVVDASTDDDTLPAGAIFVDWGNGTSTNGNAGDTISKTYTVAGTYVIKHKVTDADGAVTWSANKLVTVPVKYTVSGKVTMLNGTTPVSGASIRLKKGAGVVKLTTTNTSGNYTLTDVVPDSYTVEAVKSGLTFSSTPAANVVDSNITVPDIKATR